MELRDRLSKDKKNNFVAFAKAIHNFKKVPEMESLAFSIGSLGPYNEWYKT